MTEEKSSDKISPAEESNTKQRPKRGLEDWEMLQQREEKPLKIPYWVIILVIGLLIGSVLLSFPIAGVREGYERPWINSGLFVGLGYGAVSLIVIYFILRKRKKKSTESSNDNSNSVEK